MEERPFIVVSQMAHVCQRAVRFGDWIYIRTYHDGMHLYDEESLFHLTEDPAELHNVADQYPQIVYQAVYYLDHWYTDNMQKQADLCTTDPMWTVIHEGGPFHSKGNMEAYCERLEKTGRGWAVDVLKERHPERF